MVDRTQLQYLSLDTIFGAEPGHCRVCIQKLDDGRRKFCRNEVCRDVAYAVSGRFNWERIRDEVLERDDYTCQDCGHEADPELKNYEREIALHVDHIESVAQSGIMWDEDNLVTLCEDCHREKSRSNDDYTVQRKETRLQAFTDDNPVTRGEQVWADNYASVPIGQLRYWERTLARLHREFNKPDYAPRKLSVSRRQQVLTELMDEMLEHVDQGDTAGN